MQEYERLVTEALEVPLRGWDFSWLEGRATGSDPSWSYPDLARAHLRADLLDIDTGGGELLATLRPTRGTIATEGYAPNVSVARERLGPLGVDVRFAPDATLPLDDACVDLVLNRHGRLNAAEIARVLRSGGELLTQQVGSADCADLNAALGAPPAYEEPWNAEIAAQALTAAGLRVTDVREEFPPLAFADVGAVVYQLRAVPWQVRDFTVARYADELKRMHERGGITVCAHRFLIHARGE
ncbi:class I SAM-dependent methyltransferase [Dactylosporangium sp. CS-033363]|uniref:class I SAM-dependent methyltransferase n=1 Tax=Dactylosporangium sp. CS-033363 TaxID=3239935 RepID=UPI003D918A22